MGGPLDQRLLFSWAVAAWLHSEAVSKLSASTLLARTRNGEVMQNPFLPIVNRQAEIMRKAATEMGFTPSSRPRIQIPGDDDAKADPFARFVS